MQVKQMKNGIMAAAGPDGAQGSPSGRHPRGAVLIYTFVVLMLMTLMGSALMVNSRTELQISGSTVQGRDAFAKGDAAARIALLIGRAYLQPTAGNPWDYINTSKSGTGGRKAFSIVPLVDVTSLSLSSLEVIEANPTVQDIKNRYLRITEALGSPHMTLEYGGEVVGTVFINVAYNREETGGGSLGERDYGAPDAGYSVKAFFVVSAQGRLPQESGMGYITEKQPGTHSIITTVFREILP